MALELLVKVAELMSDKIAARPPVAPPPTPALAAVPPAPPAIPPPPASAFAASPPALAFAAAPPVPAFAAAPATPGPVPPPPALGPVAAAALGAPSHASPSFAFGVPQPVGLSALSQRDASAGDARDGQGAQARRAGGVDAAPVTDGSGVPGPWGYRVDARLGRAS